MEKLTETEVADLKRLQRHLRERQRDLVLASATGGGIPPDRMIQKIAELENAIVAVDAILQEGRS
ncbi:hypothetical protein [Alsobacter sp. SYSU BS001988]